MFNLKENSLFVFGWNESIKKNEIYEINLQTLAIKTLDHTKNYGPEGRRRYGSIVCDDRLYLFGGRTKNGEPCDKINWVYDFEKGSWFGL